MEAAVDGTDSEPELVRVDVWMQSMVPSLPRRAAIVCLVFNIVVPGLGTFTGGVLSCCIGRPRQDFRPARYRCPTASAVMFVGVLQFLFTAFFFVGWLWSIIWGFLMLNLSDPKFRVMPKPPPPQKSQSDFGAKPTIRVDKASYNYGNPDLKLPPGRKNFRKLITKARHHKDEALGFAPPLPPVIVSGETSTTRSFLSRIPIINCTGGASKMSANARSKFSRLLAARPCSSSRTNLVTDDHLEPVATNLHRKSICADPTSESNSQSTLSNGKFDPIPSEVAVEGDRFNGVVSVTPATPVHSSAASSFIIEDLDNATSVEHTATVETRLPPLETLEVVMPTTMEAPKEAEVRHVIEESKCDLNVPEHSAEPMPMTPFPDASVGETIGPLPSDVAASEVTTDESVIAPTTGTKPEVVPVTDAAEAPISTEAENPVGSKWTRKTVQNQLRPKMKQSQTYHFDA